MPNAHAAIPNVQEVLLNQCHPNLDTATVLTDVRNIIMEWDKNSIYRDGAILFMYREVFVAKTLGIF